jgi:FkbM family methyltransferase
MTSGLEMSEITTLVTAETEPETVRIVSAVLKEGDSFVIAGAHQGFYASLAASLVGPSGVVYAFEPEPTNFGILVETMEPFLNARLFNHCLGDRDCKAPFFVNSDNNGGHALWDVSRHSANEKTRSAKLTAETQVKRLDDVLEDEELSALKLILFDMEGSEHSALKGAINTIADNDVPYIICEVNEFALKQCGSSQEQMRDFLSMYGYVPYLIGDVTGDQLREISHNQHVVLTDDVGSIVFNVLFSRKGAV